MFLLIQVSLSYWSLLSCQNKQWAWNLIRNIFDSFYKTNVLFLIVAYTKATKSISYYENTRDVMKKSIKKLISKKSISWNMIA